MTGGEALKLIRSCFSQWSDRNAPRLGAALAYYTLLSIAPLLILIVAIFGLVFDRNTAEYRLLGQVSEVAGPSAAKALQTVLQSAHQATSGVTASIIALITLLFGASGVFLELRDSLNTIWDAPPPPSTGWKKLVKQRLASFGMVLALGFLLLVSLVLSAGLAVVMKFFEEFVPVKAALFGEVANFVIPLFAIAALFALIFKFVPDVPISWEDVTIGAFVSALFFEIGKTLLAIYIATAGVGSTYGAAGSLVAFVVWVYYSAQIFFFGAIFTREYAKAFGSRMSAHFRNLVHRSPAQSGGR